MCLLDTLYNIIIIQSFILVNMPRGQYIKCKDCQQRFSWKYLASFHKCAKKKSSNEADPMEEDNDIPQDIPQEETIQDRDNIPEVNDSADGNLKENINENVTEEVFDELFEEACFLDNVGLQSEHDNKKSILSKWLCILLAILAISIFYYRHSSWISIEIFILFYKSNDWGQLGWNPFHYLLFPQEIRAK